MYFYIYYIYIFLFPIIISNYLPFPSRISLILLFLRCFKRKSSWALRKKYVFVTYLWRFMSRVGKNEPGAARHTGWERDRIMHCCLLNLTIRTIQNKETSSEGGQNEIHWICELTLFMSIKQLYLNIIYNICMLQLHAVSNFVDIIIIISIELLVIVWGWFCCLFSFEMTSGKICKLI